VAFLEHWNTDFEILAKQSVVNAPPLALVKPSSTHRNVSSYLVLSVLLSGSVIIHKI
jgi:hypothetical protein